MNLASTIRGPTTNGYFTVLESSPLCHGEICWHAPVDWEWAVAHTDPDSGSNCQVGIMGCLPSGKLTVCD